VIVVQSLHKHLQALYSAKIPSLQETTIQGPYFKSKKPHENSLTKKGQSNTHESTHMKQRGQKKHPHTTNEAQSNAQTIIQRINPAQNAEQRMTQGTIHMKRNNDPMNDSHEQIEKNDPMNDPHEKTYELSEGSAQVAHFLRWCVLEEYSTHIYYKLTRVSMAMNSIPVAGAVPACHIFHSSIAHSQYRPTIYSNVGLFLQSLSDLVILKVTCGEVNGTIIIPSLEQGNDASLKGWFSLVISHPFVQ
jgi:hypothetical protein